MTDSAPEVPDREKVEKAVADIEEARESHVGWADWLEAHPDQAIAPTKDALEDNVGGVEHHREWVEKYDRVLSLIRPLLTPEPAPEEEAPDE